MVFLTAVRNSGVDAAVAYHGGDTEKYLEEVDGPQPDASERAREAFSRHSGTSAALITAAAHLANGRTSEFLTQQLR